MKLNIQPIEKLDRRDDHSLDVHGAPFYTIQGEGPFSGHPAVFVRLAGCNLQCPGCDTDYTSTRTRMSPEGIVQEVQRLHPGPRLVVITGGEPFRQNIGLLTQLLEDAGYRIQIETNGALPVPDGLAPSTVIICSPKTFRVHPSVVDRAWAWKYVLDANHVDPLDGLPTLALYNNTKGRVARPPREFFDVPGMLGAIYVQPMDEGTGFALGAANHQNMKAVIATCMKHGYTAQQQLHKNLNLP